MKMSGSSSEYNYSVYQGQGKTKENFRNIYQIQI